jgi:SAM-dependent methyltransferase
MDRLTEKLFWEQNYVDAKIESTPTTALTEKPENLRQKFKEFFGTHLTDYSNYLLWEIILGAYLPKNAALKALEIGSAPGYHLLRMKKLFGYAPYGVEYTDAGAQMNRALFAKHGIDPAQLINADAFSESFQEQHRETFDVVTSFGFVEHFDDVRTVIKHHLDLLKVGGSLVVQIPRIAGLNYLIARSLNRESLAMHNLNIMQKDVFQNLFAGLPLETQFCDYAGTAKLILCLPHNRTGCLGFLTNAIKNVQIVLNLLLRWLFKDKGFESNFFSPYLVFVGRKAAPSTKTDSQLETPITR